MSCDSFKYTEKKIILLVWKNYVHAVPFRASNTLSLYMKEAGNAREFDFYHVTIKMIQSSIVEVKVVPFTLEMDLAFE